MSEPKATLLVVEDDAGLQKQMRWSFDAYEVVIANDREQALAHPLSSTDENRQD